MTWPVCVCGRVPVPTRLRVERWSFSFMELLSDAMGRREFMTYLEKEFSGENQWLKRWWSSANPGQFDENFIQVLLMLTLIEINVLNPLHATLSLTCIHNSSQRFLMKAIAIGGRKEVQLQHPVNWKDDKQTKKKSVGKENELWWKTSAEGKVLKRKATNGNWREKLLRGFVYPCRHGV